MYLNVWHQDSIWCYQAQLHRLLERAEKEPQVQSLILSYRML